METKLMITASDRKALTPTTLLPLVRLASMVGMIRHQGEETRYHLPRGVSISPQEVQMTKLAKAVTAEELDPEAMALIKVDGVMRSYPGGQARTVLLTQHLMAYSAGTTSELAASAKLETYEDALSGIPAWAIAKAITVWNQGKADPKTKPNYAFAAPSATLYMHAQLELSPRRARLQAFDRLLKAEPYDVALSKRSNPPLAPQIMPPSASNALRRMS